MIFLVCCIVSLFYYVSVVSWPYMIYFPTAMARYSLFVLKVPLNTKQTINLVCVFQITDSLPLNGHFPGEPGLAGVY